VLNEASSEAMKTIALACSSETPRRPIGTVVTRAALFSASARKPSQLPVSTGPGATSFTRIPDLTTSSATDFVMPSTACLLGDVDGRPGRTLVPVGRGDVDYVCRCLFLHDATLRA